MPEYRRFIAYFYEYIERKKEKNAGFAKVELRNGMWRILFRLMPECSPEKPVQVFGFVREEGFLLGFPLGTLDGAREIGEEWAYQADALIGHDRWNFADLSGILMKSKDERVFLTVWDDEAVDLTRFVLELPQKPETSDTIEDKSEELLKNKEEEKKNEESIVLSSELSEDSETEQEKCGQKSEAASVPESILQKRRTFTPFSDEELTVCVQMMPCDLTRLQQDAWQVGRSSFLQHGFYQYRHLLLGKTKDGAYVIGVPGIQNPQEQYMAGLFGYQQFRPAPAVGCGQDFGYWCRQIQQK